MTIDEDLTPLGREVLSSLGAEWATADEVAESPGVRDYLERHQKSRFSQRLVVASLNSLCDYGLAEAWHDGTQRRWRLRL